jgi:L-arabinokinase
MDHSETLKACQHLHESIPQIVDQEINFINNNQIQIIVGDIPPLCFEIARRTKIPSIAITNFTWNFIYLTYVQEYPGFLPLIAEMERFYGQATLALTLPYSCQMDVFPRREAIPWITRVSPLTKDEAREKFALPRSAVIVLLSFGGLGLDRLLWEELRMLSGYYFVATGEAMMENGNLRIFPDAQRSYADLVRASDVIVTKPGYGIVADAIAHQVPILYTDRGEFAEYPMLVKALHECAIAEFIPQADLLAGKLAPYLERVLNKPRNASCVVIDGAKVAAKKILSLLDTPINPTM